MKTSLAAFALLIATAAPAFAQAPADVFVKAQTADQFLAKDNLIGVKVYGPEGKIVGDVEDLIVSDTNTVVGVVMGTGGFLGMGEKKLGVNLSALTFEEKDGTLVASLPGATHDVLEAAENFQRTKPKKSLIQRAKEKAQELTDKTATTTKDAYEGAKPAIEQAKEKAKEAYEAAKEAVAPTVEKAKEAVKEAVEAAKPDPIPAPAPAPEPAPVTPPPGPEAPAPTPTP